jgi:hypothetical protein
VRGDLCGEQRRRARVPAPKGAYSPRQLTQKGQRGEVLLTRGLWWPEQSCRVHVDDGRAEEIWRRSRTGCSREARGPLVMRIYLGSPCGGDQGVKAARDLPAARKLRQRHSSPAAVPSRIPDDAEARAQMLGSGSFQAMRRSRRRAYRGRGCSRMMARR